MRWAVALKISGIAAIASFTATVALAAGDPYLVESKVQNDLDNALSRLISRDQFLVLVSTEITNKLERKLIEGETFSNPKQDAKPQVTPMPGFLPEADLEAPDRPQQSRQLYRVVETPTLTAIKVHVTFDEEIEDETLAQAKRIAQNYLRSTHPDRAYLTFEQIPMLKKVEKKKEADPAQSPIQKKEPDEPWWAQYVPVGIVAMLAFLALLFTRGRGGSSESRSNGSGRREHPNEPVNPFAFPFPNQAQNYARPPREETQDKRKKQEDLDAELPLIRKRVLERFLSRPEAFRIFFDKLSEQGRAELVSTLKGPALDNLLSGLGLTRPKGDDFVPPDMREFLEKQEKDFAEYVQAKDWQDRQFFGFLHQLTERQLQTLVGQATVMQTAAMLRFMRPHQSARALESLAPDKRRDVIAQARELARVPFSELEALEREIRSVAVRLPTQLSSSKGDVDFWGSILTEAQDQESILQDLEQTNPGIYPNLKRYKFKLEDAATLPDSLLEKILGEADNEELGLALVTCPENVIEVILDAISPRRREFVLNQLESFRQAPSELAVQARQQLTKRFREVLT